MNVQCPTCDTVFRVDPAKVPARGVRARCSVCSGVFAVPGAGAIAGRTPQAAAPPSPLPHTAVALPAVPPGLTAPATRPPPAPRPVVPPPVGGPALAPPAKAAPERHPPPVSPPTPAPEAVRVAAPVTPMAPAGLPPAAPPGRRVINPFLSQDPATKARRLARALISDLVVYHPAKRADGLRDGTLKLLFEDEIRKCWEEYTEQVGMEMATSTAYFTEALNEILADGQTIFT